MYVLNSTCATEMTKALLGMAKVRIIYENSKENLIKKTVLGDLCLKCELKNASKN